MDTKDPALKRNLHDRRSDIAYLADLYSKFNDINLQLQGDSLNLVKTKSVLAGFLATMGLMKQRIGRRDFSLFPSLQSLPCEDEELLCYVQHLEALQEDFKERFKDMLMMEIPAWFIDPYGGVELADTEMQQELVILSTNEELKVRFRRGHQELWLQRQIQ